MNSTPEERKPKKKRPDKKDQKGVSKMVETSKRFVANKGNPKRAQCICCNIQFTAELTVIKRHAKAPRHILASKKIVESQPQIITALKENPITAKIKRAELKICGFLAEHNIPFLATDHLIPLLKDCFPDSEIAKGICLGRTKATEVTKNVLARSHFEELVHRLKAIKFSILIDESTDIASVKTSAICVRYYADGEKKIVSQFFSLIQVFSPDDYEGANRGATAEKIYNETINAFKEQDIPLKNIIGFASDGCNAMMGEFNSVASRLAKDFPGIMISKCIRHSLHLCASEACKVLPRECEGMARNIYSFFNCSSKRQAQFREFQAFCDTEPHKLLRPSQTRWLSLLSVVKRINEQWQPLLLHFRQNYFEQRLNQSEQIGIQCPDENEENKLFYTFLEWILPKFVGLNKYFQSEKVVITDLHKKMSLAYKELLLIYMNSSYVNRTDLDKIDPNNDSQFIPLKNVYLGIQVLQKIDLLDETKKVDFLIRCQKFVNVACTQIEKRFKFDDTLLQNMHILNHRGYSPGDLPGSLYNSIQATPRIAKDEDVQKIDDEWRKLLLCEDIIKKYSNLDVDVYWAELGFLEDASGKREFETLSKFVLKLLCYPHSNATVERVFSKVNLVKTDIKNYSVTKSVNSLLLTSQCVKSYGNCFEFEPSHKMLSLMNSACIYTAAKNLEEHDCIIFANEN